ncbi:hypothetical protein D9M70_419980 [compost metagenome]
MADVEADAFAGATFCKLEQVLVLDDAGAGLAVEAVGDDVAGTEDFEHLVVKRRRLADMHHHWDLQDLGNLLAELDRRHAPGAGDHMAGADLQPDDVLAVFLVAGDDAVDVDRADVAEFTDAVAGDETDRTEIEECLDALARGLDDVLAKAVEIGFAGRSGVDDGGNPTLHAAKLRAHGNVGATMPDMGMQVDPTGRDPGAIALDAAHAA